MKIVKQQADENIPNLWYFKISGMAADDVIRLADMERVLPGSTPQEWLDANEAEAQGLIDIGTYNEQFAATNSAQDAIVTWKALPGWSTWTVEQAVQWIDDNVTTTDPDTKKVLKDLATISILIRDVVEWLYISRLRDL